MELKDWGLSQLGEDIWAKKYQNNGESFDEWLDRVSGGNKDVRQLIVDKKFLFGGRILASRGVADRKVTYSNCYVLPQVGDSIEDIFDTAKYLARTFSYGGGVGIDISQLRPKGSPVNNAAKTTSGAVSFMDLYSMVTLLIGQEGRRGALMISMDCNHDDIEEFIDAKRNTDKLEGCNISVRCNNQFMKDSQRKDYGQKRLMRKLAENNWDYAEPGILYWDNINNYNLLSEYIKNGEFEYAGVNPCFTGDMKLLTTQGYKTFEELCETYPTIINKNGDISVSHVWCSGEKDTIKLKMSNGKEITCTPNHVFLTQYGDEVEAQYLKGRKIKLNDKPIRKFDNEYIGYGFTQGDGQLTSLDKSNYMIVNIGTKDHEILDLFKEYEWLSNNREIKVFNINDKLKNLGFDNKIANERDIPKGFESMTLDQKASFLQGMYTANGCVVKNHRVSYKTTSPALALHLRDILEEYFDIDSNITVNKAKLVEFNNGKYICAESYDVCINKIEDIVKFAENINFYYSYKKEELEQLIISKTPFVRSIENNGIQKVYDFTEPLVHWGIVEGRIAHNCAEEPLPAGGSCLLGAINLSEFVKKPFTDEAYFDIIAFRKAVKIAIRALNDVLDEGLELHPLEIQRKTVREWRQIGLGIMGFADMLIKCGVAYGSEESLAAIDEIGQAMNEAGILASAELAEEKGSFSKFDPEFIVDSEFMKHINDLDVIDAIYDQGLRNSQLFTIAPTGSISTMLGVSGGVEPLFDVEYYRTTKSLHGEDKTYKVTAPIVEQCLKAKGIEGKRYPKEIQWSKTIDPMNRVDVQAQWQIYIDASISSTVNLPNSTTVEEVENLYRYAYDTGCKGLTIFRDGCARTAILNSTPEEPKEQPQENKLDSIQAITRADMGDRLEGATYVRQTACGKLYITINANEKGELVEVFIDPSKSGGCLANVEVIGRLCSTMLRAGVAVEAVIDSAKGVKCSSCARSKKKVDGLSCGDIVAKAIQTEYEYRKGKKTTKKMSKPVKEVVEQHGKEENKAKCPECGAELWNSGGCNVCPSCGYSKCS